MTQIRDPATSSVIVFILLVAALVILAGVWAAVVLPNQLHADDEESIWEAITSLTDTEFVMRSTADSSYAGISIYSPLPKGSLTTRDSGTLTINGISFPIRSLVLSTSGETELGIMANGIWRKDRDGAAWIVFPRSSYTANILTLETLTFLETLAYGSTEIIPFHFSYEESRDSRISDSVTMTFSSEDFWVQHLWQAVFLELAYTYEDTLNTEIIGNTLYLSAKEGTLTLDFVEHVYSVNVGEFV